MTNQDEKKDASDEPHRKLVSDIAVMFRQSYEDAMALDNQAVELRKRADRFGDMFQKEKNKHRRELIITHQRFLYLQAAMVHTEVTMKMGFAILGSLIAGVDDFASQLKKTMQPIDGEKEVSMKMADDAMQAFLERVAKLFEKLFSDSGHEAMYGRSGKS